MIKHKTKEITEAQKLSPSLKLEGVELNVKDLAVMKDFYHNLMGFDIMLEKEDQIILGKKNNPLVTLNHTSNLSQTPVDHAGLYHFAVVFASRGDLARMTHRIVSKRPHHFSGSADHLVSEAFYFTDPEGNGIELYYDRDRSVWQWENNQVKMATLYIDPAEYIENHIVLEEPNNEISMGHFHLKVGDIQEAKKFYVTILGFDVTAELPGALFISVGGYHHHIGLNTWESKNAGARTKTLGLEKITFKIDRQSLDELKKRLSSNKIEFTEEKESIQFNDPWNNKIVFSC